MAKLEPDVDADLLGDKRQRLNGTVRASKRHCAQLIWAVDALEDRLEALIGTY
jgi:hypothetical protein